MNSKLVIFIFAFIGFQAINSSVLKNQLFNSENWFEVDEVNYINEDVVYGNFSTLKIVEFTLNKSQIIEFRGQKTPEVRCLDKFYDSDRSNNLCNIGNGKYQAELVKCRTRNYGGRRILVIKYIPKVWNKNVVLRDFVLNCDGEPKKNQCVFDYNFKDAAVDEKDDVLNDEI